MNPLNQQDKLPLAGLKVLDAAQLFAGPVVAALLGDFGAQVIKVEHPRGDALRFAGARKNGTPLWWKVTNRNKLGITLNLSNPEGQKLFKRLVAETDVLIENFRPGTFERWGLGWDVLSEINPRLVMVRTTGFGQTGPYRNRPGFGTLMEAMSGFAHITGQVDGPPTLPPFGLADGIAAHYGAFATMFALYERDAKGSGCGQFIDLDILSPIVAVLGYQATAYDQLGAIQTRVGNRSVNSAPRNTYMTADDRWVALSTSTPSIAERVLRLVGGDALVNDPRFATAQSRLQHVEELDRIVGGWMAARTLPEIMTAFEEYEGAIAPVYDIQQLLDDPHVQAREMFTRVPDSELGSVLMQNVAPRLSRTPGQIRHAGPQLGEHNDLVYREWLGLSDEQIQALRETEAI